MRTDWTDLPHLQLLSPDESTTTLIARSLAKVLEPGLVITLDGELGAGKTHFVRGLAEGLGLATDYVSSPTFTIVQEYEEQVATRPDEMSAATHTDGASAVTRPDDDAGATDQTTADAVHPGLPLYHFDVYRLADSTAFTDLGLDEYFHRQGVVLIEWADRIPEVLPEDRLLLDLEVQDGEDPQAGTEGMDSFLNGGLGQVVLEPDTRPRVFTFQATGPISARILREWRARADFPTTQVIEDL